MLPCARVRRLRRIAGGSEPFGLRLAAPAELCDAARMLTGACLCGALRYEVEGPLRNLTHCHCSMCRKHHGAPFASLVEAALSSFRWSSGEASVSEYASSATRVRAFCEICGSVAPTQVGERVSIPAGNLLGELGAVSGRHVFVGSKAPWHVIADELPQYDSAPPDSVSPDGAAPALVRPALPSLQGATHGSCLCGDVSFSVSGAPARWLQCHCSRCRRGRSAAHGSNTFYPIAQFAWRTGREWVRKYKLPEAERFMVSFCARCGGGAPVERDNVPFVLVPASLLDADPGMRPQGHIFVASKAPWYTIRDALPRFAELPPP